MNGLQVARGILAAFQPLFELDCSRCDEIGTSLPIPTFPVDAINILCDAATAHLSRQDTVLDLAGSIYIVGDIHGNIFDLVRILIYTGLPPSSRLLFLGDYVDRGEYSVEVVALLFSLFVVHPRNVFLLRGNHEFAELNSTYGFAKEVASQYPTNEVYEIINQVFEWLPIAAVLDRRIFCVHGGIAPTVKDMDQVRRLHRPIHSFELKIVADLMWSDPTTDARQTYDSTRGLGVHFGVKSLEQFLTAIGMNRIIRAHQCIMAGVSKFADDRLYTVFSCSRYEGQMNRCGLMFVDRDLHIDCFSLPPIEPVPRVDVQLRPMTADEVSNAGVVIYSMKVKALESQLSRALSVDPKATEMKSLAELSRTRTVKPVARASAISLPRLRNLQASHESPV
jgi:protein phosphatase